MLDAPDSSVMAQRNTTAQDNASIFRTMALVYVVHVVQRSCETNHVEIFY